MTLIYLWIQADVTSFFMIVTFALADERLESFQLQKEFNYSNLVFSREMLGILFQGYTLLVYVEVDLGCRQREDEESSEVREESP